MWHKVTVLHSDVMVWRREASQGHGDAAQRMAWARHGNVS